MSREIIIPPAATDDPNAVELLRVWVAQRGLHVVITSDAWKDGATWGIMLGDLAIHIANMLHEQSTQSKSDVLDELRDGFLQELANPVNDPTGSISVDSPER
jgi:hypothetical protein